MIEPSPAYILADRLHSNFWPETTPLNPEEIAMSGVVAHGALQRISVVGKLDERRVVQTLTKNEEDNTLYLTTIELGRWGLRSRRIKPNTELDIEIITSSLFMRSLVRIGYARSTS